MASFYNSLVFLFTLQIRIKIKIAHLYIKLRLLLRVTAYESMNRLGVRKHNLKQCHCT